MENRMIPALFFTRHWCFPDHFFRDKQIPWNWKSNMENFVICTKVILYYHIYTSNKIISPSLIFLRRLAGWCNGCMPVGFGTNSKLCYPFYMSVTILHLLQLSIYSLTLCSKLYIDRHFRMSNHWYNSRTFDGNVLNLAHNVSLSILMLMYVLLMIVFFIIDKKVQLFTREQWNMLYIPVSPTNRVCFTVLWPQSFNQSQIWNLTTAWG